MNDKYSVVFASEQVGNLTVEVLQDTDPLDPRDWEYDSLMVCFHNRYNLGDKTDFKSSDYQSWDELYADLQDNGYQSILSLYLYDHSGISISAESFIGRAQHAEWDSGQIGFIATKEAGKEEQLRLEVEEYDKYLQGQVYAYRIYEDTTCSSCNHESQEVYAYTGGYYSVEEALEAGKSEAPYYEKASA